MSNFYNESRQFHLNNINFEEIIADLEDNFQGQSGDDFQSVEEARTWYEMVLRNGGQICDEFIAPRATAVDEKGASFDQGVVFWAEETRENMKVLAQAGFMGGTLPRQYGGLNLPNTVNNVMVEMVSQADASLMNLYGLQDIAVTIWKYGSDEQKRRILPLFASGEVSGSMALTEPDAGSDLQVVELKATEKDGKWYLDGVKRFITNGCGEISLVLARSEADSRGGRGLSLFLYDRTRDSNMIVRRIEHKLGIHGSPTCELQFNMAEAELVGRRKFGLIKYTMSLMNGARLAVSFQALGIAQAAYEEALKYANEREQFGQKIIHFPAIYQMMMNMLAEIETTRALLMHTSLIIDYLDMYERKEAEGKPVKDEVKKYSVQAGFLTPLSKFTATEMANQVAYNALQVHGGCGYMKDFPIERLYRDARITNIYEGTTQLQIIATIGAITSFTLNTEWDRFRAVETEIYGAEKKDILLLIDDLNHQVDYLKKLNSKEIIDFCANHLVEAVSYLYRMTLYLPVAESNESRREIFRFFYLSSSQKVASLLQFIREIADQYGADIDTLKKPFLNIKH